MSAHTFEPSFELIAVSILNLDDSWPATLGPKPVSRVPSAIALAPPTPEHIYPVPAFLGFFSQMVIGISLFSVAMVVPGTLMFPVLFMAGLAVIPGMLFIYGFIFGTRYPATSPATWATLLNLLPILLSFLFSDRTLLLLFASWFTSAAFGGWLGSSLKLKALKLNSPTC
jgi:hypothetical protein